MAFPRLVLDGDTSKGVITDIYTETDTDGILTFDGLKKLKYNIRREGIVKNVAFATPTKRPDVALDYVRLVHTWVGYIDVSSDALGFSSTGNANTTYRLLTEAWIFKKKINDTTTGIPFVTVTPSEDGVKNPSSTGTTNFAYDKTPFWVTTDALGLDNAAGTQVEASGWFIKNVDISDNQNGTSRITFTFEVKSIFDDAYGAMR